MPMKTHERIEDVKTTDNEINYQAIGQAFPFMQFSMQKHCIKYHPCWPIDWSIKNLTAKAVKEWWNHHENCLVTIEDIKIAKDIFEPDIHAMKGKTVRKSSPTIEIDCIEIPKEILKLHNNIVMALDVMFVNGLLFLLTVSSKLKFFTAEFLENMKINNTHECYKTVIKL